MHPGCQNPARKNPPMATDRDNQVGQEFDRYSSRYDAVVNDAISFSGLDVDFFTRFKAADLLAAAQTAFGSTQSLDVLDLGCGVGNYHGLLAPNFASLSAIDVSAKSIAEARQRNRAVSYQTYGGGRLPYGAASFDIAFAICVLHHVPPCGWSEFVQEARRVLKPGGLFAVYEHNPLNPLTRYVVGRCPFDADAVLLWPKQSCDLMRGAGFEGVSSRSILTLPAKGALLAAADRAFARLPFGAQYVVVGRASGAGPTP